MPLEVWMAPKGYVGCVLVVPPSCLRSSALTPAMCRTVCVKAGKPFFGMRSGNQCVCAGNDASRYKLGPEQACWIPCSGDINARCGGPSATTLFSVAESASLSPAATVQLNASLSEWGPHGTVLWSSSPWRNVSVPAQRAIGVPIRLRRAR